MMVILWSAPSLPEKQKKLTTQDKFNKHDLELTLYGSR